VHPRDAVGDRFAEQAAIDVIAANAFLQKARVGARIVTFCGFGGTVPSEFERVAREAWDDGVLELWVKRASRSGT
jgi:hypothetical protein